MTEPKLWADNRVIWEAEQILRRFNMTHAKIKWQRQHYNNDPAVDPRLGEYTEGGKPAPGNPFAHLSAYQSDKLHQTAQTIVPKLAENPTLIEAKPEKESSPVNAIADDLAQVMQAWLDAIQERTGEDIGQAVSYGQVRDGYGIIHARRLEDLCPEIEFLWTDELPDDPGDAKKWIPYSDVKEFDEPTVEMCETCAGTGSVATGGILEETYEDCEDCSGNGNIMHGPVGKGAFRETAAAYQKRLADLRAQAGPPWTIEFPDAEQSAFVYDRDPRGGLAKFVWAYEVGKLDYEEALRSSSKSEPSKAYDTMADERPAPGMHYSVGSASLQSQSLSDSDWGKRCLIVQVWTRDAYYELYGEDGGPLECRKKFAHDYRCVPFWIVPANDNFQNDPAVRYEPYMQGLYRIKPFLDRITTLFGGMAELTAQPLIYEMQTNAGMSPQLPSGDPADEGEGTSLGKRMPPGMSIATIPIQMNTMLSQFYSTLRGMEEEATPQTGVVDISSQTQPWTARQQIMQANVSPKMLVTNRRNAVQAMMNMIKNWHERHPEERMYAHAAGAASKVVSVDPRNIANIKLSVSISSIGTAEQVTYAQWLMELLDHHLIKEEDFYRDGMAKKNPHDYMLSLAVELAAKPWKMKMVETLMAQRMGSKFFAGVNGETIDSNGQAVDPDVVLQAAGWKIPPQQQQAPVAGAPQMPPQSPDQQGGHGMMGAMMPSSQGFQPPPGGDLRAPNSFAMAGPP